MSTLPPVPEMERAFLKGDAGYDGIFFTAVRTTGIFCRPSCRARKPHLRNVTFFPTVREALFAGFRPCKRCRPLEAVGSHPAWVRRLLARVEEAPEGRIKDGDIRRLGIEPARARRYFQRSYGMSFHANCRGRRMAAALQQIRRGDHLDEVIMDSGYESHSGFREAFFRTFGRAPGQSREMDCIVVSWIESPLGPLVAGATEQGVCLLEFTDRRMLETQFETIRRRFDCAIVPGRNAHVEQLERELRAYFTGTLRRFTVPLVVRGTPFEEKVWKELQRIPYGETRSYEELAGVAGAPGGQRAVGRANGCNRIAIVIPCHRVVNKSGQLGGYGGGLWRKQYLLDLERGQRDAFAGHLAAAPGAPAKGAGSPAKAAGAMAKGAGVP